MIKGSNKYEPAFLFCFLQQFDEEIVLFLKCQTNVIHMNETPHRLDSIQYEDNYNNI